ncbi:MAG: FecCD family ABC transporter permease [Saccharospirillum sp.]
MSYWVLRSPGQRLALALHRPSLLRLLALFVGVLLLVLLSLSAGSRWISPLAAVDALINTTDSSHGFIVQGLRLPRTLLALQVGLALGCAGAILQQIVRNVLASPDIIGITDGASVGAALFIAGVLGAWPIGWLPVAAITGAALSALLIGVLAWKGGLVPSRVILIGIGLAAALKAVTTLVLVMNPTTTTDRLYTWLAGSFYGAQWQDVQGLLPWLIIALPVTLALSRPLTMLAMDDEQSIGLGLNVHTSRLVLLGLAVCLSGSAIAFVGGLAFVGLLSPHIARRLVGSGTGALLAGSALTGAFLVMAADLAGRTLFLPLDLPAGIFVSAIGAPFFVFLLMRRN